MLRIARALFSLAELAARGADRVVGQIIRDVAATSVATLAMDTRSAATAHFCISDGAGELQLPLLVCRRARVRAGRGAQPDGAVNDHAAAMTDTDLELERAFPCSEVAAMRTSEQATNPLVQSRAFI